MCERDVAARGGCLRSVVRLLKKWMWLLPGYVLVFRLRWRRRNRHNFLTAVKPFPLKAVRAGRGSYGALSVWAWGSPGESLEIGNYVSIAEGSRFLLGGNHFTSHVSQYPFKWRILGQPVSVDGWTRGGIVVGDDVWIGQCAIILSGVTLGQGCVVGAGAVVAKDVPPYAIVAGNPARIIKYRFEGDALEKMKRFRFDNVDEDFIRRHMDLLYASPDTAEFPADCLAEAD